MVFSSPTSSAIKARGLNRSSTKLTASSSLPELVSFSLVFQKEINIFTAEDSLHSDDQAGTFEGVGGAADSGAGVHIDASL